MPFGRGLNVLNLMQNTREKNGGKEMRNLRQNLQRGYKSKARGKQDQKPEILLQKVLFYRLGQKNR